MYVLLRNFFSRGTSKLVIRNSLVRMLHLLHFASENSDLIRLGRKEGIEDTDTVSRITETACCTSAVFFLISEACLEAVCAR